MHSIQVPFFESKELDLAIDWQSLLHGVVRGRVVMVEPRLNFVHGPTPEETQTGSDQPWLGMIDELFPFRIERAVVKNGEIHFHTFNTDPKVDVYLSEVNASLGNLTNITKGADPLMANVHAEGRAMETGRFDLNMSVDPDSYKPTFDLAARLLDVDVTRLNNLVLAYGDFDFEGGSFDLVVEASARNGILDGYAKPLFRNVRVVSMRDFRTKDPLHLAWETIVGAAEYVFKNHARDQFGTRFAIQGELDDPKTSLLEIIGNVLRNAFVQAYLPSIEGRTAPTSIMTEEAVEPSTR